MKVARALGCPIPADLHTHHSSIIDCLRLFISHYHNRHYRHPNRHHLKNHKFHKVFNLRDKSVEDLLAWEADPLAFKVMTALVMVTVVMRLRMRMMVTVVMVMMLAMELHLSFKPPNLIP